MGGIDIRNIHLDHPNILVSCKTWTFILDLDQAPVSDHPVTFNLIYLINVDI